MNKYQEALEIVKHYYVSNEAPKSIALLQELVDRATPKMVIIHNGALRQLGGCECPHCHRVMFSTQYQGKIHFCPHKDCGQSLEWEEGEKK